MSRAPFAVWRGPIANANRGGMIRPLLGLVLHIEEGTETGTDAWFHNPGAQASAHFGNPKSGPLDQWVDTDDKAWAEVDGNARWISVEHEGNSGDELTNSQLNNDAQLLAWLHATEGVPLAMSNTPLSNTPGLTFHAAGGATWGDHPDCPGFPIAAARPAIITSAARLLAPPTPPAPHPQEHNMARLIRATGDNHVYATTGVHRVWVQDLEQLAEYINTGLVVDGVIHPVTPKLLASIPLVKA